MGCTWTQDFSFSSLTIHAAFATPTRGWPHEHKYHERFDLTGYGFSGHTAADAEIFRNAWDTPHVSKQRSAGASDSNDGAHQGECERHSGRCLRRCAWLHEYFDPTGSTGRRGPTPDVRRTGRGDLAPASLYRCEVRPGLVDQAWFLSLVIAIRGAVYAPQAYTCCSGCHGQPV